MKKTKLDNQNKNQKELADYRKKAARCLEQGDIIQADFFEELALEENKRLNNIINKVVKYNN